MQSVVNIVLPVLGIVLCGYAAMPAGALAFEVAQRYNVYVQRGSAAVPVSTVISVLTISALMVLYDV